MSPAKRKTAPPVPAAPPVPMIWRCPECAHVQFSEGPIAGGVTCSMCAIGRGARVEMLGEPQVTTQNKEEQ